jgi:hypothetical protein
MIITKTALIPELKLGVFNRAVFGIENFALQGGVFNPAEISDEISDKKGTSTKT